jgi:lipopolysaccharide export system protein LptA
VRERKVTRLTAAALLALVWATPVAAQQPPAPSPPAPVTAPATAPAQPTAPATAAPQAPIHVTAEQVEYLNREGVATFTGKVVAVQGDTTLTAEKMDVKFSEPPAGRAAGALDPGRTRVTSIVATEKVTFRQLDAETGKERYAVGERGVYDADARTMTLTGNPRLWEGKNVVTGEEVLFLLETKVFKVKGKVNLTVFPDPPEGGAK